MYNVQAGKFDAKNHATKSCVIQMKNVEFQIKIPNGCRENSETL